MQDEQSGLVVDDGLAPCAAIEPAEKAAATMSHALGSLFAALAASTAAPGTTIFVFSHCSLWKKSVLHERRERGGKKREAQS